MTPTHQGFEADGPPRDCVDSRLVVQHELPAFDGAAQIDFERQAIDADYHRRIEHAKRITALVLGCIHRDIGMLQQR